MAQIPSCEVGNLHRPKQIVNQLSYLGFPYSLVSSNVVCWKIHHFQTGFPARDVPSFAIYTVWITMVSRFTYEYDYNRSFVDDYMQLFPETTDYMNVIISITMPRILVDL